MRIVLVSQANLFSQIFSQYLENHGHQVKSLKSIPRDYNEYFCSSEIIIVGPSRIKSDLYESIANVKTNYPRFDGGFVLLVDSVDTSIIETALANGLLGLVYIEDNLDSLVDCIEVVSDRQEYLSPTLKSYRISENKNITLLTKNEREIFRLVSQGFSTQAIAKILCRSQETIKTHRKNIKSKLHIKGGKTTFSTFLSKTA